MTAAAINLYLTNKITVPQIKELKLPSQIESVDEAAQTAENFAREIGMDAASISAIDLAIRESVANAVKHGNKFDLTKTVEVVLTHSAEAFEIMVRDHGRGFKVDDIPDPTDKDHILRPSGRGILFMKAFMDEVEWFNHDDGGTVVRMKKNESRH